MTKKPQGYLVAGDSSAVEQNNGWKVERLLDGNVAPKELSIPKEILDFLSTLPFQAEGLKAQIKAFDAFVAKKVLEGAEESELANLIKIQTEINQILETHFSNEKRENEFNNDAVGRVLRESEFAQIAVKLDEGAEINNEERDQAVHYLQRKNWGNIFRNVKKGDIVLTTLIPGEDFLSMKYLNDNVFGPQITDGVRDKRRALVEQELTKMQAVTLSQDYKTGTFVFKNEQVFDKQKVDAALVKVDDEMKDFIIQLAEKILLSEQDANKKKVLTDFIIKVKEVGFKMTYGVSKVEADNSRDVLLSVTQAQQHCRLARGDKNGFGGEFDQEKILSEINVVGNLKQQMIGDFNNTINSNGVRYTIFEKQGERMVLNRDVIRAVRKGKFLTDQSELLALIKLYIQKLNLFDVIKPFTLSDIDNGKLKNDLEKTLLLADALAAEERLSFSQCADLVKDLNKDEKDPNFSAASKFHAEALKLSNCKYVVFDVLDVGVDLLSEYERVIEDLNGLNANEKAAKLKEFSLSAGDQTTQRLRDFRRIVADVVRTEANNNANVPVLGLVGGDELTLAFDMSKVSTEIIDHIVAEIRQKVRQGGSPKGVELRIVQTVVSEADKQVVKDADDQTKAIAHVDALKRAETGSAIAKYIEGNLRDVNRLINLLSDSVVRDSIEQTDLKEFFLIEKDDKENPVLIKADFIIKERDGNFFVQIDHHQISYDILNKRMQTLQQSLTSYH